MLCQFMPCDDEYCRVFPMSTPGHILRASSHKAIFVRAGCLAIHVRPRPGSHGKRAFYGPIYSDPSSGPCATPFLKVVEP